MEVSRQSEVVAPSQPPRGAKARTRSLMLATAVQLFRSGSMPSVSEVAEHSGVSRATAYRSFPSQSALVEAMVDEALGPILDWKSKSNDARHRTRDLFVKSLPRLNANEATFRAALKLSLDDWAARNSGVEPQAQSFKRGHRIQLLRDAVAPLADTLPAADSERLTKALSLLFGIEALVVLKDIWGSDLADVEDVLVWTADHLLRSLEGSAVANVV